MAFMDDGKHGKPKDPVLALTQWVQSRSKRQKSILLGVAGIVLLIVLWLTIEDHDTLFVLAELAHFVGIVVLVYKLYRKKSVAGLSLKSQELTAVFLAIRLYCSFKMEYDIHTLLDASTLAATVWVVYMMRFTGLKQAYQKEQDVINQLAVVGPCAVLAFLAHPKTSHHYAFRVLWALCVYLEAVSMLPQLRMMQKAKIVERFTAHYVFALGLSRFFSCAHWLLQILDRNQYLLKALGSGIWPCMVLFSELAQTAILADFCYYYINSYTEGSGVVRLPTGIV